MIYDVAVLGGGPAGLAAAAYALQAHLRVALITPTIGGKVNYRFQLRGLPAVENVRGTELVEQFARYVETKITRQIPLEVQQVSLGRDHSFQLTLENAELISASTLIVATGAQPQRLYVPGELEFLGRGVSYSAMSHAQFFRNRTVAVIGGERALPAVAKLAAIAKRVYYILRQEHELDQSPIAERAQHDPKIIIFRQWEVQQISGDEFVTGLIVGATNGEIRTLPVDGIFVELGLLPNNELVRDLVEVDEGGRIAINHRCETNVPGLFAAGDVTNVYAEQVPVAIGEGVKAALTAWTYLAMSKSSGLALDQHASQAAA
jgi:thioredoxin reductase